jgi:hypothetical protein
VTTIPTIGKCSSQWYGTKLVWGFIQCLYRG